MPLLPSGGGSTITPGPGALDGYVELDDSFFGLLQNSSGIGFTTAEYVAASSVWRFQPVAGNNVVADGLGEMAFFEAELSNLVGADFDRDEHAIDGLMEIVSWPSVGGQRWGTFIGVGDTSDEGVGMLAYDANTSVALFASDDATAPGLTNALQTGQDLANTPTFVRCIWYFDGTRLRCHATWNGSTGRTEMSSTSQISDSNVSTTLSDLSFRVGMGHVNSGAALSNHIWDIKIGIRRIGKFQLLGTSFS